MGAMLSDKTSAVQSEVALQPRVAALSMYDLPELQAANDSLWSAIALRLERYGVRGVPRELSRNIAAEDIWSRPDLLLAQTCGYPLVTALAGRVRLVATPRYRAAGCEGPFRRSAIVVGAGSSARDLTSLRGARCALNQRCSDSGMNLLRAAVAPIAGPSPFFRGVVVTGSHLASAEAVAAGEADLAALDAVTFAHLRRFRPGLAKKLRVLDWTERTPGLPLITALATDEPTCRAMLRVLDEVARDASLSQVRETLLLDGFNALSLSQYRATLHQEARARQYGYDVLQ